MNIIILGFFVLVIGVIGVSLALMWHWKKFMPETGRGAGVFTVYTIGLVVLIMALFSSLTY